MEGGHKRNGTLAAQPDYADGPVTWAKGFAADQSESFFEVAFEEAPDPIVVFDDDGAYVYGNRAAAELLAVDQEELARYRLGDFTPPHERSRVEEIWRRLHETRLVEGHHRVVTADGRERIVDFRLRAASTSGFHIAVLREHRGGRTRLSAREREVMQLLASGLNGSAIARELVISPETVRTHVRNAMDKLGARTRPHAIALAAARGEILVEA